MKANVETPGGKRSVWIQKCWWKFISFIYVFIFTIYFLHLTDLSDNLSCVTWKILFFFLVCIIWRGFITIFLHFYHIYTHLTHYRPIADQISYPPIIAFTHVDSKDIHPFITTRVHLGCGGMGSNMWLLRCSISQRTQYKLNTDYFELLVR